MITFTVIIALLFACGAYGVGEMCKNNGGSCVAVDRDTREGTKCSTKSIRSGLLKENMGCPGKRSTFAFWRDFTLCCLPYEKAPAVVQAVNEAKPNGAKCGGDLWDGEASGKCTFASQCTTETKIVSECRSTICCRDKTPTSLASSGLSGSQQSQVVVAAQQLLAEEGCNCTRANGVCLLENEEFGLISAGGPEAARCAGELIKNVGCPGTAAGGDNQRCCAQLKRTVDTRGACNNGNGATTGNVGSTGSSGNSAVVWGPSEGGVCTKVGGSSRCVLINGPNVGRCPRTLAAGRGCPGATGSSIEQRCCESGFQEGSTTAVNPARSPPATSNTDYINRATLADGEGRRCGKLTDLPWAVCLNAALEKSLPKSRQRCRGGLYPWLDCPGNSSADTSTYQLCCREGLNGAVPPPLKVDEGSVCFGAAGPSKPGNCVYQRAVSDFKTCDHSNIVERTGCPGAGTTDPYNQRCCIGAEKLGLQRFIPGVGGRNNYNAPTKRPNLLSRLFSRGARDENNDGVIDENELANGERMSGGAIAGIVVAVLLVVGCCVAVAVLMTRRRRRRLPEGISAGRDASVRQMEAISSRSRSARISRASRASVRRQSTRKLGQRSPSTGAALHRRSMRTPAAYGQVPTGIAVQQQAAGANAFRSAQQVPFQQYNRVPQMQMYGSIPSRPM